MRYSVSSLALSLSMHTHAVSNQLRVFLSQMKRSHSIRTWSVMGFALGFCCLAFLVIKESRPMEVTFFATSTASTKLLLTGELQAGPTDLFFEVQPTSVAPAEILELPGGSAGSLYVSSAFGNSRFIPYAGAPPEERVILVVLAQQNIYSKFANGNIPVEDEWSCLLCTSAGEIVTRSSKSTGPFPSLRFKGRGKGPLSCWWSTEANRSYHEQDSHKKDFDMVQFECKVPDGLPLKKISLATLAKPEWAKAGKLEEILFAPLSQNVVQKGIRANAVPSFERFKRVEHIQHTGKGEGRKPRFSMCVGPVFGNLNGTFVEEWVSFSRLMGASHIHLYYIDHPKDQLLPSGLKMFKYLASKGYLNLYHWNLSFYHWEKKIEGIDVWSFAQTAMMMDCFYRASGTAEFVAFLDMDEFLAPTNMEHSDWFEALGPFIEDPKLGAMLFQNWLFKLEDRHLNNKWLHAELVSASVFTKSSRPYDHSSRTKYIARVDGLRLASIHKPAVMTPGFRSHNISNDLIYFRHYRNHMLAEEKHLIQDTSMLRFQEKLHVDVRNLREEFARNDAHEDRVAYAS